MPDSYDREKVRLTVTLPTGQHDLRSLWTALRAARDAVPRGHPLLGATLALYVAVCDRLGIPA